MRLAGFALVLTACACARAGDFVTYEEFGAVGDGKHDFGYVCHTPKRILVDGLRIDDSNHPDKYQGPTIFAVFNKANTSPAYVEQFPYQITQEVVLKNVTTASGRPLNLSANPYMFRNVKIVRPKE